MGINIEDRDNDFDEDEVRIGEDSLDPTLENDKLQCVGTKTKVGLIMLSAGLIVLGIFCGVKHCKN